VYTGNDKNHFNNGNTHHWMFLFGDKVFDSYGLASDFLWPSWVKPIALRPGRLQEYGSNVCGEYCSTFYKFFSQHHDPNSENIGLEFCDAMGFTENRNMNDKLVQKVYMKEGGAVGLHHKTKAGGFMPGVASIHTPWNNPNPAFAGLTGAVSAAASYLTPYLKNIFGFTPKDGAAAPGVHAIKGIIQNGNAYDALNKFFKTNDVDLSDEERRMASDPEFDKLLKTVINEPTLINDPSTRKELSDKLNKIKNPAVLHPLINYFQQFEGKSTKEIATINQGVNKDITSYELGKYISQMKHVSQMIPSGKPNVPTLTPEPIKQTEQVQTGPQTSTIDPMGVVPSAPLIPTLPPKEQIPEVVPSQAIVQPPAEVIPPTFDEPILPPQKPAKPSTSGVGEFFNNMWSLFPLGQTQTIPEVPVAPAPGTNDQLPNELPIQENTIQPYPDTPDFGNEIPFDSANPKPPAPPNTEIPLPQGEPEAIPQPGSQLPVVPLPTIAQNPQIPITMLQPIVPRVVKDRPAGSMQQMPTVKRQALRYDGSVQAPKKIKGIIESFQQLQSFVPMVQREEALDAMPFQTPNHQIITAVPQVLTLDKGFLKAGANQLA
jgi:hypothetical protein